VRNKILALLSLLALSGLLNAEYLPLPPKTPPAQSFSINALEILWGNISGAYESRISEQVAITIPVEMHLLPLNIDALYTGHSIGTTYIDQTLFPISITSGIGLKVFLSGPAFESGWYISPNVLTGFGYIDSFEAVILKASVMAGYSWVSNGGFTINTGIGAKYDHWFIFSNRYRNIITGDRRTVAPAFTDTQLRSNYGINLPYPTPTAEISFGYTF